MIVSGFDLSYTCSAGVWINKHHQLVHSFKQSIPQGAERLGRAQTLFFKHLKAFPPELVVIEDNAYGAANRVVVVKLSQLNAVLKATCDLMHIPCLEVSPSKLKRELTGKGNADKAIVARELKRLYDISFENDKGYDLSDAASAAIWGLKHGG